MDLVGLLSNFFCELGDEWWEMTSDQKRQAIHRDEWIDFVIAQPATGGMCTFAPADLYERLAELVEVCVVGPSYVRGFADADGGMIARGVAITNTDEEILRRIGEKLSVLGISHSIYSRRAPANRNHSQAFDLCISSARDNLLFFYYIGFSMSRKQDALARHLLHYTRTGTQLCLEQHNTAIAVLEIGKSQREAARAIGVHESMVHKRLQRGGWPLSKQLVSALRCLEEYRQSRGLTENPLERSAE